MSYDAVPYTWPGAEDWKPYIASQEDVQASRERLERARALEAEGKLEESRRVWWTDPGDALPARHYSQAQPCTCRDGGAPRADSLCRWCGGKLKENE